MPSSQWMVALQIVGVVAAISVVIGKWIRPTIVISWVCLLTLAGLKGSYGKILHNDLLLLFACVPILFAPLSARLKDSSGSVRFGWPVQTSLAVISIVYLSAGIQKLIHSGFAWVASDNMRWVLYDAASSQRVKWPNISFMIADRPWLSYAVAGTLLAGELLAPFLIFLTTTRRLFITYAFALHLGTWLTLGLDYWSWALTVGVVLYPWHQLSGKLEQKGLGNLDRV